MGDEERESKDLIRQGVRGLTSYSGGLISRGLALLEAMAVGKYTVEIEYKAVGAETTLPVEGRVVACGGADLSGFAIELVNSEALPPWRSGRMSLAPNGAFVTSVWAEKGKHNAFAIDLYDETGTRCPATPDLFTYTASVNITDTQLIHSIGIALPNNEVERFFNKGASLPARRLSVHRTAFGARRGDSGDLIRIPVIEGENKRADRNRLIGYLGIPADKIKRDLPAGSEIEITIEIDESRIVRTRVYIPILNEEFEGVATLKKEAPDPDQLEAEIGAEKRRLADVRQKTEETGEKRAQQILARIAEERTEQDLDASLAASRMDNDAADKCKSRLLDLQSAIDEIEQALEWPTLLARAAEEIKHAAGVVRATGNSSDKQRMATLERETRQAMDAGDSDLLQRKVSELVSLAFRIENANPRFQQQE